MSNVPRLLNATLAGALATLRHGETIYLGDAGGGTDWHSLVPLDPRVEVLDLGIATGVPSIRDLLPPMLAAGHVEALVVTRDMRSWNPELRDWLDQVMGAENVHEIQYLPDMYRLRNRTRLMVKTGEYTVHGNVVLVGGYPSPPIPVDRLLDRLWADTVSGADAERGEPR